MHLPYYPNSPMRLDSLAILNLFFVRNCTQALVPKILNMKKEVEVEEKKGNQQATLCSVTK